MTDREETAERPGESGLTTENLAHPEQQRGMAVYPGEATPTAAEGRPEAGRDDDADAPGAAAEEERGNAGGPEAERDEPLLDTQEAEGFRTAWDEIQSRFVDDPQDAVKSADTLVAEVMQALAQSFSAHKQGLEGQWGRGEEVATEELRLALQRYRSFFNRLLKT